jgi:hypothetical protein
VEGWLSYKAKVWNADKAGRLDLMTDDGLLPLLLACRLMSARFFLRTLKCS